MELYVDESGNLGKKDRYFVIVMLMSVNKKRIKNFIKSFSAKEGLEEIKASKLNFSNKQYLFNKLSKVSDYRVSYIVLDKHKIQSHKLMQDKNLCFNYLFMHLSKNIILNARENIHMYVDEHTIKVSSINSLKDYLRIKAYTEWNFRYDFNLIFQDSKNFKLIQAADLVANAIWAKYNYNQFHFYNHLHIFESIKFPYKEFGK